MIATVQYSTVQYSTASPASNKHTNIQTQRVLFKHYSPVNGTHSNTITIHHEATPFQSFALFHKQQNDKYLRPGTVMGGKCCGE